MICHLLQVGCLPCVYEPHHFFKDVWLDVNDVDSVLEKLLLKEVVLLLHAQVITRISLGYSSYSYLLSILHFMFKHCFKDRRPCCQINTHVITIR